MTTLIPARLLPREAALRTEAGLLYIGAPALMTVFFGAYSLFAVVWALALVTALLLSVTPTFRWRSALRLPPPREWRLAFGFTAATAALVLGLVLLLRPWALLRMPQFNPELWLLILTLYPPLSALPQELMFRTLFFERYGELFPRRSVAIALNGVAFGFAHLFYMNAVAVGLTALGGAALGWVYLRTRSLLLVWVLHAIGGCLIFTLGLGTYFYHGAVDPVW